VAATLRGRRPGGGVGRERATTRRGQERRARTRARTEPPAAVTARRPCAGVSAPSRRLHFVERHARARRGRAPDETRPAGWRGAGDRDRPTSGWLAQATDRRGARGHHGETVDGDGNGRKEGLGDRGIQGPSQREGDRGRTPMEGRREEREAKFGGWSGPRPERSKTRGWERADHAWLVGT
jgi:hypothetical protein